MKDDKKTPDNNEKVDILSPEQFAEFASDTGGRRFATQAQWDKAQSEIWARIMQCTNELHEARAMGDPDIEQVVNEKLLALQHERSALGNRPSA